MSIDLISSWMSVNGKSSTAGSFELASTDHVEHVSIIAPGCYWSAVDIGRDSVVPRSISNMSKMVLHWRDFASVDDDATVVESIAGIDAASAGAGIGQVLVIGIFPERKRVPVAVEFAHGLPPVTDDVESRS